MTIRAHHGAPQRIRWTSTTTVHHKCKTGCVTGFRETQFSHFVSVSQPSTGCVVIFTERRNPLAEKYVALVRRLDHQLAMLVFQFSFLLPHCFIGLFLSSCHPFSYF